MPKKKISSSPMVYSTNPSFIKQQDKEDIFTLRAADQKLKVLTDKKHRAGKIVTIITGFTGTKDDMGQLSKELKSFCGTGGSAKDEVIIIQGDNREKVFQWLTKNGYTQVVKQ
ncbi:MAG: translation initiation factor [Ginsengibacter sp.]